VHHPDHGQDCNGVRCRRRVGIDPPAGHGYRKGVLKNAIDYLTQRWWRTLDSRQQSKRRPAWTGSRGDADSGLRFN
jgi:hypothetical protein